MANPIRAEVEFGVGDKTYVFRLGNNELVELQQAFGFGLDPDHTQAFFDRLKAGLGNFSPADWRLVMYHGLRRRQSDVTLEDAGDVLDTLGRAGAVDAFTRALEWAMPVPRAGGDDPKAESRGPGSDSSPPAAEQA